MKKVTLVFPDVVSLTDFILVHRVNGIEVNSRDLLLAGVVSEHLVRVAITEYGAEPLYTKTFQP